MAKNRSSLLAVLAVSISLVLTSQASATPFNDLGAFQASTGALTLIDFETDGAGGTPVDNAEIGNSFSSLGITFSEGNQFEQDFIGPVSGDWGWINDTSVDGDRVFDAVFTVSGIRAVGVHNVFNGSVPNGGLLEAFDASDNLIASVLSDGDGETLDFFGVTTNVDITRFTVSAITPNGWGLDDLYFGPPVPEPSAALLFGIGALVVGFATRRR